MIFNGSIMRRLTREALRMSTMGVLVCVNCIWVILACLRVSQYDALMVTLDIVTMLVLMLLIFYNTKEGESINPLDNVNGNKFKCVISLLLIGAIVITSLVFLMFGPLYGWVVVAVAVSALAINATVAYRRVYGDGS